MDVDNGKTGYLRKRAAMPMGPSLARLAFSLFSEYPLIAEVLSWRSGKLAESMQGAEGCVKGKIQSHDFPAESVVAA